MTYRLVVAATKVLNLPASAILELFGKFFFEFCVESGYDKILSVLGSTTKDFLENLDALHDHLSTIYPGMRAPSFRCSENSQGNLVLHYYSDRPGLEFIVIGLVKIVALKLHKSEVECRVIKEKGEDGCDHVQFEIIEKNESDGEKVKSKKRVCGVRSEVEKHFSNKQLISPQSFCQIFPFHIIFDCQMNIIQCGNSIARLIPKIKSNKGCKLTDIFSIIRPHINFDYQAIRSQIMSVFVLCTKNGILCPAPRSPKNHENGGNGDIEMNGTRFKGQMVYLHDKDFIMFMCSPNVMSLEDLYK